MPSSTVPAMPNMSVPGSSPGPPSGQHVTCWFQQVSYLMYDNPLSGRIANSIVQLMVISGNYRWLLGLRPRPHQGGCSSPLDPRLLPGSMLRIDMAWPPGKYRFQRPLLKSRLSGSKGCCGTGFRTLRQSSTGDESDTRPHGAVWCAANFRQERRAQLCQQRRAWVRQGQGRGAGPSPRKLAVGSGDD